MTAGRVTVNGSTVTELGSRADPTRDEIRVDGRRIGPTERRRYLLVNKPRGYISTRSDPQGRRTVLHLLAGVPEYVYSVGRLDYDSEGLVLLTNDGELASRLTHPRHGVERVYEARVRGVPGARDLSRLSRGVVIDGRRTAPAGAKLVRSYRSSAGGDQAVLLMTLTEGRNRQVRRMCEATGHPIIRLRRVRIGPIRAHGLKPGQFRELTVREVEALRQAIQ